MNIQVKENVSKTLRGLTNELVIMAKGSGNSIPQKLVRWGKWEAISRAPHFSGATKRAIQIIDNPGGSAKLRLNQPTQKRTDPRSYHLWMHGINAPTPGGGKQVDPRRFQARIHSGDPEFMFTVKKLMEKRAKEQAEKSVKRYAR